MSTPAEREQRSADVRELACGVLARLYELADQLDEIGEHLRAEVHRRAERKES